MKPSRFMFFLCLLSMPLTSIGAWASSYENFDTCRDLIQREVGRIVSRKWDANARFTKISGRQATIESYLELTDPQRSPPASLVVAAALLPGMSKIANALDASREETKRRIHTSFDANAVVESELEDLVGEYLNLESRRRELITVYTVLYSPPTFCEYCDNDLGREFVTQSMATLRNDPRVSQWALERDPEERLKRPYSKIAFETRCEKPEDIPTTKQLFEASRPLFIFQ